MCDSLPTFSYVTPSTAFGDGGSMTTRAPNAVTRRSPIARIGSSAVGSRFSSVGSFADGIRRSGHAS
jgi:hypothetical protein